MNKTLADKSRDFWNISMAYHQRTEGPNLTTGDAISLLNELEVTVGPQKALAKQVFDLQDKIIEGVPNTQKATN
jgi:hypothetical protein